MQSKDGQSRAQIKAIRNYFPAKIVTNKDLEKQLDTNDEWIRERTGIQERRLGEAHETPAFMGSEASKQLLSDLKMAPEEIDVIICATITGDYSFPATACLIQNNIGAKRAWAFDISAACSGYLYGLDVSRALVESGQAKNVLLIGAEKMSAILDYKERSTCILFGDGGAASLICRGDDQSQILASLMRTDGSGVPHLLSPSGGSLSPLTAEMVENGEHFAKQEGRAVYKRAVVDMAEVCVQLLDREGVKSEDIKMVIPHQANLRIIESMAERLKVPMDRVAVNISHYGNTTAATIPTALQQAHEKGQVQKGDLILLCSFGAGFTWGATLLKF